MSTIFNIIGFTLAVMVTILVVYFNYWIVIFGLGKVDLKDRETLIKTVFRGNEKFYEFYRRFIKLFLIFGSIFLLVVLFFIWLG